MSIALFVVVWSSIELWSALWWFILACFSPFVAIWRMQCSTLGLEPPLMGVRGSFANGSRGSFCHSTKICFPSSGYWLQHCISAAFTLSHHFCFPDVHLVWSQLWVHWVPVTPLSHGNMLKATNVPKSFWDCGQCSKPILQDRLSDNQCSLSHGNHLLPSVMGTHTIQFILIYKFCSFSYKPKQMLSSTF